METGYQPIRNKMLVRLDPENRTFGGGLLVMPDVHQLKVCKRCHLMMEALADRPCVPIEIFEQDEYHDRPDFKGYDYSHDVELKTAPVVAEPVRKATVLKKGPQVSLNIGDRILVEATAGGTLNDVRIIRENVVLALVEEE